MGTQHASKAADPYIDVGNAVSVKQIKRHKPLEPLDPLDLPRPPTRGKQPLPAEAQKYVRSILYEDYETYARSCEPSRREANPAEKDPASDNFLTTTEAKANSAKESPWDAGLEKVSFRTGKKGDETEADILAQKRREQEKQNLKRSVEAFTKMAEEYRKAIAKSVVDDGDMVNTQDKMVLDSNTDVHMGRASRVEAQLKNSKMKNSVFMNDNGKEEELALQSPSPSPSSYCAKVHPVYPSPSLLLIKSAVLPPRPRHLPCCRTILQSPLLIIFPEHKAPTTRRKTSPPKQQLRLTQVRKRKEEESRR
jgi:hypothetical protein